MTLTSTENDQRTAVVVVDSDVSMPPVLANRWGILAAPSDPPLMIARENIPRLLVEAGLPLEVDPVVEACRAASTSAVAGARGVLYVAPGDGHGHPVGAEAGARGAVETAGGTFGYVEADGVLMAAGWRAVVAAEALESGANLADAAARARGVETGLMALVEHPELAGDQTPGNPGTTQRIVATISAEAFSEVSMPRQRDEALRLLRDDFAASVAGRSGLRVVVHYGGVGPAAEAMAIWIERHVQPLEVHAAAITRHAATRYGPGFVGIAWMAEG